MAAVMTADQPTRVAEKLRRELGLPVLALMEDDRTEDVVLNPDGSLWVCRLGEGFVQVGRTAR